jgi:hypothetical protein
MSAQIPLDRIRPNLLGGLCFEHLQQGNRSFERLGDREGVGNDAGGVFGSIEACDDVAGSRLRVDTDGEECS